MKREVISGFSVGREGYGGVIGRTTIMGIVGGTVSEIAGGEFANGAVTGAFNHLYNYLRHEAEQQALELRAKGFKMAVINDGSGKDGYYAVNS